MLYSGCGLPPLWVQQTKIFRMSSCCKIPCRPEGRTYSSEDLSTILNMGMGKWKWLPLLFAFSVLALVFLVSVHFTQINGITSAVNNFFDANNQWAVTLFGREYSWSVIISGILLTIFTALYSLAVSKEFHLLHRL